MITVIESTSQARECPLCGADLGSEILHLTAEEVARANWSYQQDKFAGVGLDPATTYSIIQCSCCAFVFAGEIPAQAFLDFIYDEVIDVDIARSESFSPHNFANRMDYLSELLKFVQPGERVLDFGCGFGSTLSLLHQIDQLETVGFEPSIARVRELERWHPRIVDNIDSLRALDKFDVVILDNVLEHVPNPKQTLEFIVSLCRAGAMLYVSVPDVTESYLRYQVRLNRSGMLLGMDINPWEHLNYFDVKHLDSLMEKVGFIALRQEELSGEVRVGLRPESNRLARCKNAVTSLLRCAMYAITGDVLPRTTRRFYRLTSCAHQ